MSVCQVIHGYFVSHWQTLGGEHFIELCTGLNIALLSWAQFQDRLRLGENLLSARIASDALTLADIDRGEHLKRLADGVYRGLRWAGKFLWPIF